MNIQAEKLNLLQTIINSNDAGLINDIRRFLNSRKDDWFDELNDEQKADIIEGIAQADNNETVSHAEVVKLFGKWGLK